MNKFALTNTYWKKTRQNRGLCSLHARRALTHAMSFYRAWLFATHSDRTRLTSLQRLIKMQTTALYKTWYGWRNKSRTYEWNTKIEGLALGSHSKLTCLYITLISNSDRLGIQKGVSVKGKLINYQILSTAVPWRKIITFANDQRDRKGIDSSF